MFDCGVSCEGKSSFSAKSSQHIRASPIQSMFRFLPGEGVVSRPKRGGNHEGRGSTKNWDAAAPGGVTVFSATNGVQSPPRTCRRGASEDWGASRRAPEYSGLARIPHRVPQLDVTRRSLSQGLALHSGSPECGQDLVLQRICYFRVGHHLRTPPTARLPSFLFS